MKPALSAYLVKFSQASSQIIGPLTASEIRGFEADLILFNRKVEPEDRADYLAILHAARNSTDPRMALLVPAPAKKSP